MIVDEAFVERVGRESFGASALRIEAAALDGDIDLRDIGHILTEAVTGHQPLDEAMVARMAREIAFHLISEYSNLRLPRDDLSGRIPSPKLVRILDYIGANIDRAIKVEELACEAGLSPAHFSRAFAKSTGRAPHAYILARRVAKAAHLLRNSSLSLDQIAAQCGFHDQAHFNHVFKRAIGATPRGYRVTRGR